MRTIDVITGVTVTLSLTRPTQTGNQLVITLTAPDGQTGRSTMGHSEPPPLWTGSTSRSPSTAWRGSRVNGTYTLTIDDEAANNTGGR